MARYDQLNSLLMLAPEEEVGELVRAGGIGEGYRHNRTSASRLFGVDLRRYDLAAEMPAETLAAVSEEGRRRLAEITRLTRRTANGPNRITYGDLVHATPTQLAHTVIGNPYEVADVIQVAPVTVVTARNALGERSGSPPAPWPRCPSNRRSCSSAPIAGLTGAQKSWCARSTIMSMRQLR